MEIESRKTAACAVGAVVAANAAVWAALAGGAAGTDVHAWQMPSTWDAFFEQPQGALLYMFAQRGTGHLAWNMAWLVLFGTVMCRRGGGWRVFSATYLGGGLAGALFFIGGYSLFLPGQPVQWLMGASAAVVAVAFGAWIRVPKYRMFGFLRVDYTAMAVLFAIFAWYPNVGTLLAHTGGFFAGFVSGICSPSPAKGKDGVGTEAECDEAIRDKIRTSGFEALTDEERRIFGGGGR